MKVDIIKHVILLALLGVTAGAIASICISVFGS